MASDPAIQPTISGLSAYIRKGGTEFWITAMILSLLVPPAGLIIAIYLLIYAARQKLWGKYLALCLMSLALAIAGTAIYYRLYSRAQNTVHHYTNYSNYKLPGFQAGVHDGVSLAKPEQFVTSKNSDPRDKEQVSLVDYDNKDTAKKTVLASILISSSGHSIAIADQSYYDGISKVLNQHQGASYDSYVKSIQKAVSSATTYPNIDVASPTSLNTPNITKNAWLFTFTARDKKNSHGSTVKGEVIFALGYKTHYYISFYSTKANWDANTVAWQKVINSIKIDQ